MFTKTEVACWVLGYWLVFSFMSSLFTSLEDYCKRDFPIHYILYSKLFCEIEK